MAHFIVYVYPFLLWLLLAAWVVLLALNAKTLLAFFRPVISRRTALVLGIVLLAALLLRTFVIPHVHRVFYDELKHMHLASNMARLGVFAESLAIGEAAFDILKPPPYWPGAFHAVLAVAYRLSGFSPAAPFALNAVFGTLSIAMLFFLSVAAFRDGAAALVGAVLLSLLPVHLKFSGSADLTASSLFWVLTALTAWFYHRQDRGTRSRLLFLVSLGLAVNSRPENAVLLLPLALAGARPGLLAAAVCFAAPAVMLASSNAEVGARVLGLSHLARNAFDNLRFLLAPSQLLAAALGAFGLYQARRSPEARTLAAAGAAFFLVYAGFAYGDFLLWDWPTASDRYSLVVLAPLLVFAGLGAARLSTRGRLAALAAAALLSVPSYARLGEFPLDEQERYRFMREAAALVPPEAYVISFSPGAVDAVMGRRSFSPEVLDEALARLGPRAPLVLFEDLWWPQRANEAILLQLRLDRDYEREIILRRAIGDQTLAIHRLTPKAHAR